MRQAPSATVLVHAGGALVDAVGYHHQCARAQGTWCIARAAIASLALSRAHTPRRSAVAVIVDPLIHHKQLLATCSPLRALPGGEAVFALPARQPLARVAKLHAIQLHGLVVEDPCAVQLLIGQRWLKSRLRRIQRRHGERDCNRRGSRGGLRALSSCPRRCGQANLVGLVHAT